MITKENYSVLKAKIKNAGKVAQAFRKDGLSITTKGRQDFVSQADIWVEDELKSVINQLFPKDLILGEEGGFDSDGLNLLELNSLTKLTSKSNLLNFTANRGIWVLDPIDGTTNYLQNMDYWCISVAYIIHGYIEVAFIYAPDRDEFFYAKRGEGAFLNDEALKIRDPEKGKAILGVGRSNRIPLQHYLDLMVVLDRYDVEHRRFGSGALMLAHVSSGLVHGYYEAHLNSWDSLAGLLLIEEAGGYVSDFLKGSGLLEGKYVWAATPILWELLQAELNSIPTCSKVSTTK